MGVVAVGGGWVVGEWCWCCWCWCWWQWGRFAWEQQADEEGPEEAATSPGKDSKPDESLKRRHSWLLRNAPEGSIKVEEKWKHLVADHDELAKVQQLKGRIHCVLEAMDAALPQYSETTFTLALRKNEQGLWHNEVYTMRDMQPNEILLAPSRVRSRARTWPKWQMPF